MISDVAGERVELSHQAYETQAVKPLRPAVERIYRDCSAIL